MPVDAVVPSSQSTSVNLVVVRGACRARRGAGAAVGSHARRAPGHHPPSSEPLSRSRSSCGTPPRGSTDLDVGDEIVVVGRVRRRFFRAGRATGSRVEIEAEPSSPARDRRRVQAVLRRAVDALEELRRVARPRDRTVRRSGRLGPRR